MKLVKELLKSAGGILPLRGVPSAKQMGRDVSILFFLILALFIFKTPLTHAATTTKEAPKNGLVGYWSFDEGTSTKANDYSGNGNTGNIVNGSPWLNGKHGKAVNFNGSTQFVDIANPAAKLNVTGPITISAWVNLSGTPVSFSEVVDKESGSSGYSFIVNSDRTVQMYIGNGTSFSGVTNATTALQNNKWYFITGMYDGTNVKVYVNGIQDGSSVASAAPASTSGQDAQIGDRNLSGTKDRFFNGSIDDVRIYNRALSAAEVTTLYQSGEQIITNTSKAPTKNATNLVGYWSFDSKDISGTTAYDRSGQGNNGTLTLPKRTLGKIGQALTFDANSSMAVTTAPSIQFGGSFSFSFWNKTTSLNSSIPTILISGEDYFGNNGWAFIDNGPYGSGHDVMFRINGTSFCGTNAACFNRSLINDGKWHHIVGVYTSGSSLALYVDNVLQNYVSAGNINQNTYTNWLMGGYGNADTMDEVRVYNRALSTSDIQTLYTSGLQILNASKDTKGPSNNNGIVGLWSFDGKDMTASTALDRSGQGDTGTLVNGPTPTIGKMGQALSFDGATQYISTGSNSSLDLLGTYTMSTWIKLNAFPTTGNLESVMGKGYDGNVPYYIDIANPTGTVILRTGTYSFTGNINYDTEWNVAGWNVNTWHHIVAIYTGTQYQLYFDGALASVTGHTGGQFSGTKTFEMGALDLAGTQTRFLNGALDDVRVYNRALSAAEVRQLYLMGK